MNTKHPFLFGRGLKISITADSSGRSAGMSVKACTFFIRCIRFLAHSVNSPHRGFCRLWPSADIITHFVYNSADGYVPGRLQGDCDRPDVEPLVQVVFPGTLRSRDAKRLWQHDVYEVLVVLISAPQETIFGDGLLICSFLVYYVNLPRLVPLRSDHIHTVSIFPSDTTVTLLSLPPPYLI